MVESGKASGSRAVGGQQQDGDGAKSRASTGAAFSNNEDPAHIGSNAGGNLMAGRWKPMRPPDSDYSIAV